MKTFRVRWEIDLDADTRLNAVRLAETILRDPESIARVYTVKVVEPSKVVTVDLDEIDEKQKELSKKYPGCKL